MDDNQIRLAVGNTTVEALSALIKDDIVHPGATPQQISDYEVLLDALQLNLLHDLEENGKALISLEEALHTRAFSKSVRRIRLVGRTEGSARPTGE